MSKVCNDDVEVPSQKVTWIHLLQKPHPLPRPQYCVEKENELWERVIYIELFRRDFSVKEVPPYTMHKFSSFSECNYTQIERKSM